MTINEYQQEAMRTASGMNYKDNGNVPPMLLNGVMGLNGESGECIDILKRRSSRVTGSMQSILQRSSVM